MRSLLIAPAEGERLAGALSSGADAVAVDLACAPAGGKEAARALAGKFLKEARGCGPRLIVKVSPLDSDETDSDLDAAMAHAPDAILLPGGLGAASVQRLSAKIAVREAGFAVSHGSTRIIAVVDTARALFALGSYRGASARLIAIAWSAEALRADIGARTGRDSSSAHTGPCRLARDMTLFAAASAGVAALDAAFTGDGDLRAEALAARRDGFSGKIAVDSAQAGIINDVFRRE